MFLLRDKLIMQGEKRETSNQTCNETMLRAKFRFFCISYFAAFIPRCHMPLDHIVVPMMTSSQRQSLWLARNLIGRAVTWVELNCRNGIPYEGILFCFCFCCPYPNHTVSVSFGKFKINTVSFLTWKLSWHQIEWESSRILTCNITSQTGFKNVFPGHLLKFFDHQWLIPQHNHHLLDLHVSISTDKCVSRNRFWCKQSQTSWCSTNANHSASQKDMTFQS